MTGKIKLQGREFEVDSVKRSETKISKLSQENGGKTVEYRDCLRDSHYKRKADLKVIIDMSTFIK